jgi:hypothetical protein
MRSIEEYAAGKPKAKKKPRARAKPKTTEGVRGEPLQPNPTVYPACSTCQLPYVLRLAISISQGECWAWFRDCKHKTAPAITKTR